MQVGTLVLVQVMAGLTLREPILLAEGTLAVGTLDAGEAAQVSGVPAFAQLDRIHFDIPGVEPHTISPTVRFPDLRSPVVIDGANDLLNFPVLSSAMSNPDGDTQISGTYDGAPNITLDLEFFSNSTCDPAGNGEAETPLGVAMITTDGAGSASFQVAVATNTMVGQFATASATDIAGNTSELSACEPVVETPPKLIFMDSFEN